MSLLLGAVLATGCQQSTPSTTGSATVMSAPPLTPSPEGGAGEAPVVACSTTSPTAIAVGQRTVVENGVRYPISDSPLSVCVEQAGWPRGEDRRHRLSASFVLSDGRDRVRFTPAPDQRIVWRGYAIFFGIARPSHTAPGLWIRVEREPAAQP